MKYENRYDILLRSPLPRHVMGHDSKACQFVEVRRMRLTFCCFIQTSAHAEKVIRREGMLSFYLDRRSHPYVACVRLLICVHCLKVMIKHVYKHNFPDEAVQTCVRTFLAFNFLTTVPTFLTHTHHPSIYIYINADMLIRTNSYPPLAFKPAWSPRSR